MRSTFGFRQIRPCVIWRKTPTICARLLVVCTLFIGLIPLTACHRAQTAVANADGSFDVAAMSLPAPPRSFDPTATVSATDRAIFSLTNGTLFKQEDDGRIVPLLAESIRFTNDYKTATVKLRPNLRFSDGSDLTAHDVAATFMRNKAVKGSVLAAVLNRIEDVRAVDTETVRFAFTAPFPGFAGYATVGAYGIYPASGLARGEAFFNQPVTSGAYRMVTKWSASKLKLAANPYYSNGRPSIRNLTITQIEDGNSALSQLRSGDLDFAGDLPPNLIGPVSKYPGLSIQKAPIFGFYDLRFSNRTGPFTDINLRKAVAAAIDRSEIAKVIWNGNNTTAREFWPTGVKWHRASIAAKPDMALARAYMKASRCANGCSVRMIYSDQEYPFSSQLALIVQHQLQPLGIEVRLERVDASSLIQRLRAGNFDMAPGAMSATIATPDQLATNALLGSGPLKAEFTSYHSADADRLIAVMRETTGAEQARAASALGALVERDVPFLILAPWIRESASRIPPDTLGLMGPAIYVKDLRP
jgi:peptide/nickel transport system substrate-binding protein